MGLEEKLEDPRGRLGVHARAVVVHRELDPVRGRTYTHVDPATDDRVLYGVRHEVAHDLHDPCAVLVHPGGSAMQLHLSTTRDAGGGERSQRFFDRGKYVD